MADTQVANTNVTNTELVNAKVESTQASQTLRRIALFTELAGPLPASPLLTNVDEQTDAQALVRLSAKDYTSFAELIAKSDSLLSQKTSQGLVIDFTHSSDLIDESEGLGKGLETKCELDKIGGQSAQLFMLPALTAAKAKLHPHAVWTGLGEDKAGALESARRQQQDLSLEMQVSAGTASDSLSAFALLIKALHRQDLSALNELNALNGSGEPNGESSENGASSAHIECQTPSGLKAHYWFKPAHQARVASCQFAQSSDSPKSDQTLNLILTQGTGKIEAEPLLSSQRLFFVAAGNTQGELESQLESLSNSLPNSLTDKDEPQQRLIALMEVNLKAYLKQVSLNASQPYALVLQANSTSALKQEISAMLSALGDLFAKQTGQYRTPAGSYFTIAPQGQTGLTFVYPGVGTVYQNMLSSLHRYFPALYARLEREGNLADILQAHRIYDGTKGSAMSLSELAISGVGTSYLLTKLLTQEFQITPHYALGYSMGEASMWASLDIWQTPHKLIEATQTSPIFTTAISGKLTSVRQDWQLGESQSIKWNSFVVRTAPEAIEALLPDYPRAYLAIIQGDTCVLAGCEQSCQALLKQVGKRGIAANRVTAMHTPPALKEHQNVEAFYCQALKPRDVKPNALKPNTVNQQGNKVSTQFISAANNAVVKNDKGELTSQVIAKSIADTFCNRLDFTGLIQASQQLGAKLFVEVGADRQTSTLIDKINKDAKPSNQAVTAAIDSKGGDDATNVLKLIAILISHRVNLSLLPLIQGLDSQLSQNSVATASMTSDFQSKMTQGEPV